MGSRENLTELKFTQILDPVVVTADVAASVVDNQNYESLIISVLVGESGDTLSGSVLFSFELEHSDDNVTFVDCADADLSVAVAGQVASGTFALVDAAAEDDAVYNVAYKGNKRYVKCKINAAGTHTNGTPIGMLAIQGYASRMPVS